MKTYSAMLALLLLFGSSSAVAVEPPRADRGSGAPIGWSDVVSKRGPVAVLVWASWAPGAAAVIDGWDEIALASRESGLHLVVVDVQETLADARAVLGPRGVPWIHDRHGSLLKQYRVIKVPSIVVVSAEGEALAHLDPTVAAVAGWRSP
jgi:hypothetical protein